MSTESLEIERWTLLAPFQKGVLAFEIPTRGDFAMNKIVVIEGHGIPAHWRAGPTGEYQTPAPIPLESEESPQSLWCPLLRRGSTLVLEVENDHEEELRVAVKIAGQLRWTGP